MFSWSHGGHVLNVIRLGAREVTSWPSGDRSIGIHQSVARHVDTLQVYCRWTRCYYKHGCSMQVRAAFIHLGKCRNIDFSNFRDVSPRGSAKAECQLTPWRSGRDLVLVAHFSSDQLQDIDGATSIDVVAK